MKGCRELTNTLNTQVCGSFGEPETPFSAFSSSRLLLLAHRPGHQQALGGPISSLQRFQYSSHQPHAAM